MSQSRGTDLCRRRQLVVADDMRDDDHFVGDERLNGGHRQRNRVHDATCVRQLTRFIHQSTVCDVVIVLLFYQC